VWGYEVWLGLGGPFVVGSEEVGFDPASPFGSAVGRARAWLAGPVAAAAAEHAAALLRGPGRTRRRRLPPSRALHRDGRPSARDGDSCHATAQVAEPATQTHGS
jgi:hypothetical protein